MAKSNLTAQRLRELLHYNPDTGIFTRIVEGFSSAKIGDIAGTKTSGGYLAFSVDNRRYQAHRLAWLYVHGKWPSDQIDHIDGNRTNNKLTNLRESSHKTNHQNLHFAHADNKSGILGVTYEKRRNRFKVQIYADGKNVFIGRFMTAELAKAAYLEAKREKHLFCTI